MVPMAMFNPFLPSFLRDPYPAYAALRAEDPVHRSPALQAWIVTSYDECEAVLLDSETFGSDPSHATSELAQVLNQQRLDSPLGDVPVALTVDPPAHTRLRGIVNRAFTPRTVEHLHAHIDEVAQSLLDGAPARELFDVMTGLAQPLPVIVIAELLGVPPADRDRFKRWSTAIAGTTSVLNSAAEIERARQTTQELIDYFGPFVEQRRAEPREDLISALVQAEEEGERLSPDELLAFCILLLVAGNETTTNLIGNGMLALLRHPQQAELLHDDRSLIGGAVEEFLRYDSPVQGVVRWVRSGTTLGGHRLAAGDTVMAMVGAANRDPARFAGPDRLDVGREGVRHLSFGLGIHFCLGAPLARLEAAIAFDALLSRFPEARAAEAEPARGGTFMLRGLERLMLAG